MAWLTAVHSAFNPQNRTVNVRKLVGKVYSKSEEYTNLGNCFKPTEYYLIYNLYYLSRVEKWLDIY